MGAINEIDFDPTQQQGGLAVGLDVLSEEATYSLQLYTRVVLPVDGFVFWAPRGNPKQIKGSFHYALEIKQDADEVAAEGDCIFTSMTQLGTLGQTGTAATATVPSTSALYVITVGENPTDDPKTAPVRFAFNRQGHFYAQAGVWHYSGRRIMPAFATQLLDPGNTIDLTRAVKSDSTALWLAMNSYQQAYDGQPTTPGVTLYPADMSAENLAPPYATVDIVETEAIGSAPLLNGAQFGSHTQLCKDTVDITLYGLQNNEALLFQDFVNQYSLDTDYLGVMNMPVVKDVKRTAPEIQTLAMKKMIRYEISYYQSTSTSVGRQLITQAVSTFLTNPSPL
jgi:hypothetical protein